MTGARLKTILGERGLKHGFIARAAGLSDKQISSIINGRRKISADEAARLAGALGMTISEWYEEA